jgi:hypothetical protein
MSIFPHFDLQNLEVSRYDTIFNIFFYTTIVPGMCYYSTKTELLEPHRRMFKKGDSENWSHFFGVSLKPAQVKFSKIVGFGEINQNVK